MCNYIGDTDINSHVAIHTHNIQILLELNYLLSVQLCLCIDDQ